MLFNQFVPWLRVIMDWIDTNRDLLTVAATIAIAVFTFTLYRATSGMLRVARDQSKDMKDSIVVAQNAAEAAKKSAQVAKDTLTSTRRAFVFLKRITVEPIMLRRGLQGYQEGQMWMFSPCWENSGDTPTINLTISINNRVFDDEIPNDFDFPYDKVKDIYMAIGPKGEAVIGAFAIPYTTIEPLQGSQISNLYIWVEAKYSDIIENPHRTCFCIKMLFLTQQIIGEHDVPTFIYYDRYNCSDEDCD